MKIINFIYVNMLRASLISIGISCSIFFIFSLFGNFNEKFSFTSILFISILNSIQIFCYVPIFILIMSLFIFINSLKIKNEFIILKSYVKIEMLLITFLPLTLFFTFFEINKGSLSNKIEDLKETFLVEQDHIELKVFLEKSGRDKKITILKNLDLREKDAEEYIYYEIVDNKIKSGEYSNDLFIENKSIYHSESTIYENNDIFINKIRKLISFDLDELKSGELLININSSEVKKNVFFKIYDFIFFFLFYLIIFLIFFNKRLVERKVSLSKALKGAFLITIYYLIIQNINLIHYDIIFKLLTLSVLLISFFKLKKYE